MLDAVPRTNGFERLLDAAEALSGLELRRIATEGPAEALADTRAAQPLLYLADYAWAASLRDAGLDPDFVAGHSLGEFAALAFAGVFSVEAGLELVCERARLMASTAAVTPGTMAAVLGMDRETVVSLVADISGVWVANDNGPGQVVISGTHPGVQAAQQALAEAGARRVVSLDVAGPFHSPLMQPAAEAFEALLASADFAEAVVPVIQNTDPRPATDSETIRARLASQITSPVRWTETMAALVDHDVGLLIETGPGAVLSGIARRFEGLETLACEVSGIEAIVEVTRT